MRWQRFTSVLKARDREFVRDRSALAWNILFPLLIVIGFAFAFSGDQLDQYKVGVISQSEDASLDIFASRYMQFIDISESDKLIAINKVQRHQLDMLLDARKKRYWVNDSSPAGYMLEKILAVSGGEVYQKESVKDEQIRYVDWLIPGVWV